MPVPRLFRHSFHVLDEFAGSARSCIRQLEAHNARRRKATAAKAEQKAAALQAAPPADGALEAEVENAGAAAAALEPDVAML